MHRTHLIISVAQPYAKSDLATKQFMKRVFRGQLTKKFIHVNHLNNLTIKNYDSPISCKTMELDKPMRNKN